MMYRNVNPSISSAPGQWNDIQANGTYGTEEFFGLENFGFICEWETVPASEIFTWNNHRYQVLNDALIWEQAKSRCESLGGHLVTIISQAEQSKIEELLSSSQLSHNSY
ncbi:MAG: C-type lectin domain-containing protein [Synergistaceae bacterium]|nr:C-type lectin domain-containing protein [Synergistaceae bacterium]